MTTDGSPIATRPTRCTMASFTIGQRRRASAARSRSCLSGHLGVRLVIQRDEVAAVGVPFRARRAEEDGDPTGRTVGDEVRDRAGVEVERRHRDKILRRHHRIRPEGPGEVHVAIGRLESEPGVGVMAEQVPVVPVRRELAAPLGTRPSLGRVNQRPPNALAAHGRVNVPPFEVPDRGRHAPPRVRPQRDLDKADERSVLRLRHDYLRRQPVEQARRREVFFRLTPNLLDRFVRPQRVPQLDPARWCS